MKRDGTVTTLLSRELIARRERAGLTQGDLAHALSTDVPTIWRAENSQRSLLVEELVAYARALGVRASTIIRAIENGPQRSR